jgi:hypothetical protein
MGLFPGVQFVTHDRVFEERTQLLMPLEEFLHVTGASSGHAATTSQELK